MATSEITVAVESAVHKAFRRMAQEVWDQHGICVQSVRFSWIDVSSVNKPRLFVTDVEAETRTLLSAP